MHIVLLGAARRGYRFLETLATLVPDCHLTVLSFREEPSEPPFLDDIRALANARGAQFREAKTIHARKPGGVWEQPFDLLFAVGWRYMVPSAVYRRARLGAYVFHDSLLPKYRGFSPTVWAMINGEDHTGVTLFEMAESVDSGLIVGQERVPIGLDDDIAAVQERVTQAYLSLLAQSLPGLRAGALSGLPQDESQATYTCKRLPEDNKIDWRLGTREVYNLIRAVTRPYPGAYTTLNGDEMRVWRAERLPDYSRYVGRVPGRVVEIGKDGAVVLTGDGALLLTEVQVQGREPASAALVLNSLSNTLR